MYGIAHPNKANDALRQVERNMWQHLRESPRDNLDNEKYIFASAFKDAICVFIHENKRLPKKAEFAAIKDEHLTKSWAVGSGYNFDAKELTEHLGKLEWKQEYQTEWVMDKGEVSVSNDDSNLITSNFINYLTSEAASESALGSVRGLNKYNIDHSGI